MERTRILRRVLELKFKAKGPMGQLRRWFSQVVENIKKSVKAGKKLRRKGCGKKEGIRDFPPTTGIEQRGN
jgi:hypothetical protein